MLQYWQHDYGDLIEIARTAGDAEDDGAIDSEMRVLAANALYRVAERGPQDRATLLKLIKGQPEFAMAMLRVNLFMMVPFAVRVDA